MKHVVLKGNKKYIKQEYKKEELKNIFSKHYQQIVSLSPRDLRILNDTPLNVGLNFRCGLGKIYNRE